ncbi:hypothetical protein [uncultured Variovorax sp.]|uniref:hypothetical protein n=1 Tax=uncultured Variovorax sp. TaxID=114708 RepID=UPI002609C1AE|nr:hypothetical protein [uncultured Variovorax sp.]
MMFWLDVFVGLGAASLVALLVLAVMSCASDEEEEEQAGRLFDLHAAEFGR